ncbi:hypothetical protein A3731_09940 [Roseovarius sp. HI0049]|nr:hypothetical protein A3731_09940 [Roseovarius sp. HI0049]
MQAPETLGIADPSLDLIVIGAGFGGIGMAARALRAGLRVLVLERANGLGGTWRDNIYPGCACDTQSHHYSFSFAMNPDWSRIYATQPEILSYLRRTAEETGVTEHLRCGVGVRHARWDEEQARWQVTTEDGASFSARFLVSAVGQLNQPMIPDFEGRETFGGKLMHTAQWDADYDLTGKRVVVIGNAASAVQAIPQIAKVAGHLTVLQRSPNWLVAKGDRAFRDREKRRFRALPFLQRLYRWSIYWQWERSWPEFIDGSRQSRRQTEATRRHISAEAGELAPDLTPDYPLGCRRILLADDYYPALQRENVSLVTDQVERLTPDGLLTKGGQWIEADCIVLATGFHARDFLPGLEVEGRGGQKLSDRWEEAGGPEAYLGIAVPGFPNFFLLYGPNTNLGHNSIIFMLECQIRYVLRSIARLRGRGESRIEVRQQALQRHRRQQERELARTAWAGSCTSWYKTATGRIINNWSAGTVKYWWLTRRPKTRDFTTR